MKELSKMAQETYKMAMICNNCGTRFAIDIPKGESVPNATKCPYCGVYGLNKGSKPTQW